jgi:hypothetical protein
MPVSSTEMLLRWTTMVWRIRKIDQRHMAPVSRRRSHPSSFSAARADEKCQPRAATTAGDTSQPNEAMSELALGRK